MSAGCADDDSFVVPITDRSVPLEARLVRFYREYSEVILTYQWIRLFMFAGLKDLGLNARYLKMLRERVL